MLNKTKHSGYDQGVSAGNCPSVAMPRELGQGWWNAVVSRIDFSTLLTLLKMFPESEHQILLNPPLALAPPVLGWSVVWTWPFALGGLVGPQSCQLRGLMSGVRTLEPKLVGRSRWPTGSWQSTLITSVFLEGLPKRIRPLGISSLSFPDVDSWNDGIRNGQHHPTTNGLHVGLGFFLLFKTTFWFFQMGSKGIKPRSL